MNNRDLKVLQKVYENVSNYDWGVTSPAHKYFSKIDYPMDADRSRNVYYSEVKKGLIIVTGTYRVRFYYEEDNYTWDKKYFASLISDRNNISSSIAFITNEDYEDLIAKKDLFNLNVGLKKAFSVKQSNIIISLYDSVNRIVIGADDLYNEFLDDEE